MHPLAHHLSEDSLLNLLLISGTGLSLIVVEGRARLAAARARLTRRVRGPKRRADRRPMAMAHHAAGARQQRAT
jgi:hypothetical protein